MVGEARLEKLTRVGNADKYSSGTGSSNARRYRDPRGCAAVPHQNRTVRPYSFEIHNSESAIVWGASAKSSNDAPSNENVQKI